MAQAAQREKALDNSILRPIVFVSKNLSNPDKRCSNIEREGLGITEEVHQYCFAREVGITTNHKLLLAIFKKDVVSLSQRIQLILLRLHQYRVIIIYNPGPDLLIADWLSRQNHRKNKDAEIPDMLLNIVTVQTTTNIPDCMKICKLQQATSQDECLPCLKEHIIQGWPENKRSNTIQHENILDVSR